MHNLGISGIKSRNVGMFILMMIPSLISVGMDVRTLYFR